MKKTRRQPRRGEAAWRQLLARHAESGLPTLVFCANEGVSSKSFYRWRSKLNGSSTGPLVSTVPSANNTAHGFIDLGSVQTAHPSRIEVRLDLGGGVQLYLVRE